MKEKVKEVIVPKWFAWINLILISLIIILILYINFTVPEEEKIPFLGLIILLAIFFIVILIFFLSAYKGLPIYYLKEK